MSREIKKEYKAYKHSYDNIFIIGRFAKESNKEYWQTSFEDGLAVNSDGEPTTFVPVFLKKDLEKFEYEDKQIKLDKRNQTYILYTLKADNVFIPLNENGKITKVIVMK